MYVPPQLQIAQHITATVSLAGQQHATLTTHGTEQQRGAYLSVAYLNAVIWLYDRRAATTYATIWNEASARIFTAGLPLLRRLNIPSLAAQPITLGIRGSAHDEVNINPGYGCVIVSVGHIRWAVYDQTAFASQITIWDRVTELAAIVLP